MKNKSMKMFFAVLILAVLCCIFPAKKVEASYSIAQSKVTQNSATVTWDAEYSQFDTYTTTGYVLYISTDYSTIENSKGISLPAGTTSYTFNKLKAGTEYYVRIYYNYTYNYTGEARNNYTSCNVATLPGKVTGVGQERWWRYALNVDVTWDKQTAADGYQYVIKNSKGKTVKSYTNTYNSTSGSCSIKNNMLYTIQVRAYETINGEKVWGAWSKKAYLFTQPEITKLSIKNGKLTVKWQKISGATGYSIYISTKQKSGYKKVATVKSSASTATIKKFLSKKFNKKKTYYVYVAALKKAGKTTYNSGANYTSPIVKGVFQTGLHYIN